MNELKYLKEFQEVLSDYTVSEASKSVLANTRLMLFAAATSAGRNTIFKELLKTNRYHYIVSDTTRKPRVNDGVPEQNGVEYWFKSEEEMLKNLQNGRMLEAAVIHDQQVSGISIAELEKAQDNDKIAVTDIDVVGTENIVKAKPDTMCLFIIPPSFDEWQKRLQHRGKMEKEEYCRRLKSAVKEFQIALDKKYYWIIVNDNLSDAVGYIDRIAQGQSSSSEERQEKNRKVLEELLERTKQFLDNNTHN